MRPITSKEWTKPHALSADPPPRKSVNFLRGPFQIGAPAAVNTDASLGFSRMGYQSPFIAQEICGGKKNMLREAARSVSDWCPSARRVPPIEARRRLRANRLSVESRFLRLLRADYAYCCTRHL